MKSAENLTFQHILCFSEIDIFETIFSLNHFFAISFSLEKLFLQFNIALRMWMCVDEDDNIMCGCGRFTWETQPVTLQSDSPVGMTKHGFNARSAPLQWKEKRKRHLAFAGLNAVNSDVVKRESKGTSKLRLVLEAEPRWIQRHIRWDAPQLHWGASARALQLIETVQATQHVNAEVHTTLAVHHADLVRFTGRRWLCMMRQSVVRDKRDPNFFNSTKTSETFALGLAIK